ncbi:hypothetical protein [Pseudomonas moorei]|uniref:hypothetical protein n=1 Tax=Pseudomonas moorei TaxID=395599 RepID=UPI001FF192E1|nr:hypothetical protein [Pseudomonas moorei]
MLIFIGIVAALIGFTMMSRPFKVGFALYLAFLAYYVYLYGGKADLAQASTGLSLIFGAVGLLILGAVLGGIRSGADSEAQYLAKRKRVLLFLLKFGGAYVLFTQVLTVVLFLAGGGRSWDDWTAAGLMVKVLPFKWVGYLVMLGGYYWLKGKVERSRGLRT